LKSETNDALPEQFENLIENRNNRGKNRYSYMTA